jgi:hypothetical protein
VVLLVFLVLPIVLHLEELNPLLKEIPQSVI